MHTTYTGERVRLRPFKDKDEYRELVDSIQMFPNDFWGPWWTPRIKVESRFDEGGMLHTDKYSAFAMERLDTGELVGYEEYGSTGAGQVSAWLGTFIRREHWHNGFGVEAKQICLCHLFENYPFASVMSDTLCNHVRAARGLNQCGMYFEGRLKKVHYTDGRFYDIVSYRIMREDWEKLPIRQTVKRGG